MNIIITTQHGIITRPIETLQIAFYSKNRGLCVEYSDSTGKHLLTGVTKIETSCKRN